MIQKGLFHVIIVSCFRGVGAIMDDMLVGIYSLVASLGIKWEVG